MNKKEIIGDLKKRAERMSRDLHTVCTHDSSPVDTLLFNDLLGAVDSFIADVNKAAKSDDLRKAERKNRYGRN